MNLKRMLLPENHPTNTQQFFKDYRFDSLTIHWTGDQINQSPAVVREWFARDGNNVSAHFIIKDDICIQCIPTYRTAYHCGNPVGNATSLGIEIIAKNTQGEFSDQSIATLRTLVALFPPVPILRHYDWSGKNCPKFYLDEKKWKDLLLAISPATW